jgi:hypothetical protein
MNEKKINLTIKILMMICYFIYPFVFAEFRVECALLVRSHTQRESRAQLLNAHFLAISEYVAMVSKENVVALIVKRDAMSTLVLRIGREQRCERSAHLETESSVEVVQDDFRLVFGEAAAVLKISNSTNRFI